MGLPHSSILAERDGTEEIVEARGDDGTGGKHEGITRADKRASLSGNKDICQFLYSGKMLTA